MSESVREALERAGCRYTPQREAVLAHLRSVTNHPTVDQVYEAVRRELPRISLATVYNTLELLVERGLIKRLSFGRHAARYDARCEPHYHFHDVERDEVYDLAVPFDADLLAKIEPQLAQRLAQQGFRVSGYHLIVEGRVETRRDVADDDAGRG